MNSPARPRLAHDRVAPQAAAKLASLHVDVLERVDAAVRSHDVVVVIVASVLGPSVVVELEDVVSSVASVGLLHAANRTTQAGIDSRTGPSMARC